MQTPRAFREELRSLMEEAKRFLDDIRYYDVTSSAYLQIFISQKVHQLEGMDLQLEEYEKDPKAADLENMYQVFRDVKSDIYVAFKKWKMQVEYKYKGLKSRFGKLYYVTSMGQQR